MSHAIVVVGPTALRGPRAVDSELGSIALDGIDDDLVLVDEWAVTVDEVWRDLFAATLGDGRDTVILVVPSWWSGSRMARVRTAAGAQSGNVVVQRRVDAWATGSTVVEIAPDLVVVHADAQRHAVARVGAPAAVVDAVVACVAGLSAVTVDVPSGLTLFGVELGRALRRSGIAVTTVDDRALERAVRTQQIEHVEPLPPRRVISPRAVALAGAALAVTTLTTAAVLLDGGSTRSVDEGTWLVEGRIAVEVPAQWTVERVTSGPGSARVEVLSPSDRITAIHVTQSRVPNEQTLDATAEALRLALAEEPDGIFVDFAASGHRAERAVVSYREIRPDRHVAWAVMLDRGVRIAIGCQGAPGGAGPAEACDRAVRTAHAVS